MATYLEIKTQIDALQREADALKNSERKDVIARMKEAISTYDITAADLGFAVKPVTAVKKGAPAAKSKSKSRPKRVARIAYADANGNTWAGRGKRPNWLREALANGGKLEDFAAGK